MGIISLYLNSFCKVKGHYFECGLHNKDSFSILKSLYCITVYMYVCIYIIENVQYIPINTFYNEIIGARLAPVSHV